MVQDNFPDPNFPWNQNAERCQYQNRIQNYNYYRPEYGNSSSSTVMNMVNPSHATDSTYNYTIEQLRLPICLRRLKPLGLKLNISPELASWMERQLNAPRIGTTGLMDSMSQQAVEKVKPENTHVNMLRIGSWQRVARNESDVVVKCYFGKKKLVWEILEGNLKSKIEVQWSDIIAIDACIRENEPGVLRVELKQRPLFFQEKDPLPKKHTIWMPASDFTGGEASKCRRHEIVFPPGKLDNLYEKLLLADQDLSKLSRNPFPSFKDPFFPSLYYFCHAFNPTPNPVQYPNPQQLFSQLSSPPPISDEQMTTNAAMWGEMLPEPNPNVGLVSYDTAAMGNQYLAPERRYDSNSVACLSDGHINNNNNNLLFDNEMSSSQFSGSVSEESPSSVDKNFLMRRRLEILGNLEIAHDTDLANLPNEMFYNQQQQQQVLGRDPAAAGLITSGEMYVQQHQQGFVPDPAAAGLIISGREMYEHEQQQSGFYGYPYPVGGIADPGMMHFDQGNNIERVLRMDLDPAQQF